MKTLRKFSYARLTRQRASPGTGSKVFSQASDKTDMGRNFHKQFACPPRAVPPPRGLSAGDCPGVSYFPHIRCPAFRLDRSKSLTVEGHDIVDKKMCHNIVDNAL